MYEHLLTFIGNGYVHIWLSSCEKTKGSHLLTFSGQIAEESTQQDDLELELTSLLLICPCSQGAFHLLLL